MHLHIISFDVPFPANYGGVIDVFYKIKALAAAGVKIHLHAFVYGRPPADELARICESVHYYPRKNILKSLPVRFPHIVSSRASQQLLENLSLDDIPILFEGLHTTYYLSYPQFESRKKLVRMHNIEWEYYYQLAQSERRFGYKKYYQAESRQLQKFEDILPFANYVLTISHKDTAYYKKKLEQTVYVPAFHSNYQITSLLGRGEYCLYHGNLSVAENNEAAMFLVHEVFDELKIPLIIAGADPSAELIEAVSARDHVVLRHNPGDGEMLDLWRNAHVHVLPTFQSTGIKLKLINSLFNGRFVVANPPMVNQTGLAFCCKVAENPREFIQILSNLMKQEFTQEEIDLRKSVLDNDFSNEKNAQKIIDLIRS